MDFVKSLQLNQREILLALAFAVIGFLLSTREFILWLNSLNPFTGFLVYLVMLYALIFVLSKFDLVIFDIKIRAPAQVFGLFLITVKLS